MVRDEGERGIAMTTEKMRPRDAARFIGIAVSTLARMRMRGEGPPFSKPGSRIVIYDRMQIEQWLGHCLRGTIAFKNECEGD